MSSEAQTKVILKVIKGFADGKSFEFIEQDNFLLGRDAPGTHAHFRLSREDKRVSRDHFLIEINPPDCHLRDAGSLNGTFIIRPENMVFYLEGRDLEEREKQERRERIWREIAQELVKLYQCKSHQKMEGLLKLEGGDVIKVGDTCIEVKIVQEVLPEAPNEPQIQVQKAQSEEEFYCFGCGKDITSSVQEGKAKKIASGDYFCEECCKRHETPTGPIYCWGGCGKDLATLANSDGRAEELKNIALYWCDTCVSSKKEKVPISSIGDYHLLKELGSGGFGVVYLAWHKVTGRIVALKITKEKIKKDKKLRERFKREINIMKTLCHPHLVRLYDNGTLADDKYYFISEYLPEGSLADCFRKNYKEKMLYKEACSLIVQALDGLSYFHNHKRRYVHRDLKPENIILKKDGKAGFIAKVADFGLSRSYVLHGGTITKKGEWAGTLFFCPPEQINDFKNAKPYTDIYSMGISLYLLITGEFPYDFPTKKKFLEMISKGKKIKDPLSIILGDDKPTPIEKKVRDIPKKLAKVINRAIEKDASKRFSTANEFKKALEEYLP